MIISISLQNFYSIFDEATLDFVALPLGRGKQEQHPKNLMTFNNEKFVNIIGLFGSNAAGKSNFIKAVDFCRRLVLESHRNVQRGPMDFEPFKFSAPAPSKFSIRFVWQGTEYDYSFTIEDNRIVSESLYHYPNKRRAKVFERENTTSYTYGKGQLRRTAQVEESTGPQTLFLSQAASMNRSIAVDVVQFFAEGMKVGMATPALTPATRTNIENNKQLLLDALAVGDSDIIDFNIIETPTGALKMMTYHREMPTVGFDFDREESQGTKRLFYILLSLVETVHSDTALFFDELDVNLHVHLTEFLLDIIRESQRSQLVFTSHNAGLLNREQLRDEQIVFVTKLPDGSSEFVPLCNYEDVAKIKDLQKAYLLGVFDGVPYIGTASSVFKKS